MSSHNRKVHRTDESQPAIVKGLRDRHISVDLNHDDILVGYAGRNYWFEIKSEDRLFKADGVTFKKNALRPSQIEIRRTWRGHYCVVWSLQQILDQIGFNKR